jgi:hypothetical protein
MIFTVCNACHVKEWTSRNFTCDWIFTIGPSGRRFMSVSLPAAVRYIILLYSIVHRHVDALWMRSWPFGYLTYLRPNLPEFETRYITGYHSGEVLDSYFWTTWFKSWPGDKLSVLSSFLVLDYVMTTCFFFYSLLLSSFPFILTN